MKGTDINQWQIDAAAEFIKGRRVGGVAGEINDDRAISIKWGEFVRLVAWYGAIRAEATQRGIGPNEPGHVFSEKAPPAAIPTRGPTRRDT